MAIFGQSAVDITGALFKSKNLSDIPNPAAARTALNVPSNDSVLYNSVPIGMIFPFWGSVAPAGYLPCMGQTVNSTSFPDLVTFLGGTTSAVVPDLRGQFLRGWDNGKGVDVGRTNLSSQLDSLQNITGGYGAANNTSLGQTFTGAFSNSGSITPNIGTSTGIAGPSNVTFDASRVARTSTETRPTNVAILYCIKAYNSLTNYTSNFNIAGLTSDYSTLNAACTKYADFNGTNQSLLANGYQKLPGGIIIQWGSFTASATAGNPLALTFPISFPNAVRSIAVAADGVTTSAIGLWTDSASTSTFNGRCNVASQPNCRYIAIGY